LSFTLREAHRLRIFESRLQRRKFRSNKDEMIEDWRKFHSDEFYNLNSPPNMIRIVKSRSMRWAGHETSMDEKRDICIVLYGNQKDRDHLVCSEVGKIVSLKLILQKQDKIRPRSS
jgi:hypothetical protein